MLGDFTRHANTHSIDCRSSRVFLRLRPHQRATSRPLLPDGFFSARGTLRRRAHRVGRDRHQLCEVYIHSSHPERLVSRGCQSRFRGSTLKATAGHGSTSLWSSRDLEDFITIVVCEPSCFSIKGTATAFTADKERTIPFTQSDFVMRSSPNQGATANRRGRSPLNGSGRSTSTARATVAFPAVAELERYAHRRT
jgi:hypothetical protein